MQETHDVHSWWCECKGCLPQRQRDNEAYVLLAKRYKDGFYSDEKETEMENDTS